MAPIVKMAAKAAITQPRILVVDDEPTLIELVDDVVRAGVPCKLLKAGSVAEARKILATQGVELMVADVNLPDGSGQELLATLRDFQPCATAIVITGSPSVEGAITAMREGAIDFLPKPFSADSLLARVNQALARQKEIARKELRIDKLRDAVKRLNEARRLVSKKVDLLCNDLITAYGDLSKQLDIVRTQEGFRKLMGEAKDLEQMLCHSMDWLLRQIGYSNVAIWLSGDDADFQLGAYMKYTIAGEPAVTEPMRAGLVQLVNRESFVHLTPDEAREKLTPAELKNMAGHCVVGVSCTYLGESLATIVMFREAKTPFTDDDLAALKAISPIFATSLASTVRGQEQEEEDGGSLLDDDVNDNNETDNKKPRRPRDKSADADWWKRGEQPPF